MNKNILGLLLLSVSFGVFASEPNYTGAPTVDEQAKANKAPVPSAQTDEYLSNRDKESALINSGQKRPYMNPQSQYDYSEIRSYPQGGSDYSDVDTRRQGY